MGSGAAGVAVARGADGAVDLDPQRGAEGVAGKREGGKMRWEEMGVQGSVGAFLVRFWNHPQSAIVPFRGERAWDEMFANQSQDQREFFLISFSSPRSKAFVRHWSSPSVQQ